jgi:hypothetical protein
MSLNLRQERLLKKLQEIVEKQTFFCLEAQVDAMHILDRVGRGIDQAARRFQQCKHVKSKAA